MKYQGVTPIWVDKGHVTPARLEGGRLRNSRLHEQRECKLRRGEIIEPSTQVLGNAWDTR